MIVPLVVSILSFLACVIGLAIPYWLYQSDNGGSVSEGLWKLCTTYQSITKCVNLNEAKDIPIPDGLNGVRAMEIIGMLLIAATILCAILHLTVMKEETRLLIVSAVLAIVAGAAMLIGTIIYGASLNEGESKYLHAGFGLCIVGGILAICAGVVFIFYKSRRTGSYSTL